MTRKGGGRDSGGAETQSGRRLPRTQEGRPTSAPAGLPETPAAAAIPAASRFGCDYCDAEGSQHPHVTWLHKRIRELEAERNEMERRWREMMDAYQELEEKDVDLWKARAELAEDAERACKAANESQRKTIAEIDVALRVAMLAVDKEALREDSIIPLPIANLLHDTLESRLQKRLHARDERSTPRP